MAVVLRVYCTCFNRLYFVVPGTVRMYAFAIPTGKNKRFCLSLCSSAFMSVLIIDAYLHIVGKCESKANNPLVCGCIDYLSIPCSDC